MTVRKGAPPILLIHGSADTVVRIRNANSLLAKQTSAGGAITLKANTTLTSVAPGETVIRIKELLYGEGFTVAGARKKIEQEQAGRVDDVLALLNG